jgi:uncharacterized protein YaiI (UPF0178 family)
MVIYVDADACPVKDEIYRVAARNGVTVVVVANSWMRVPEEALVRLEVVNDGFDAADDWIAEQCGPGDVVVTIDILLAERCLKKGAFVLGHKGAPFTEDNIGDAVATREIMADMRAMGEIRGGPPPFQKKDRGIFSQALEKAVVRLKRKSL